MVCLNWEGLRIEDCGLWSETELPPDLRHNLREPGRYQQAIQRINKVHREDVFFRSDPEQAKANIKLCLQQSIVKLATLAVVAYAVLTLFVWNVIATRITIFSLMTRILVASIRQHEANRILGLLKKAVGEANILLWEEDILLGCVSQVELLMARVPLSACKEHLADRFDSALLKYSSAYVCYLAQRHLDSAPTPEPGHLQGGLCFCQYAR